ncbi:CDP-alcohol phosphatidyltransferase family protein [uncultured Sphaerochaeta sp.]|uniref:CDP-alcohol phosphatidyltransferase family protein n=1 Tax=uncultured Sphaerochaeta sp. TaxID=886478 RepID=UPI002A0A530E|nr:CDP-alcohol phosphatidyltransferase family protein [uncultured Sphaerochaeta sp.]
MKWLPNALSYCRIVLSLSLLFVERTEAGFLLLYVACGLTDWADGFLARKLNCATALGARLDSIADIVFSFVVLYLIFSQEWLNQNASLVVFILLIIGIRVLNMMITVLKFRQWNVIHTIGNKMTGIALFLFLPIQFIFNPVPPFTVIILLVLALGSSLEETCILLFSATYDVNRKSILHRI